MWKDYSKSYIRYNRASGLQICAAALTASFFLTLFAFVSYNLWVYEMETRLLEGTEPYTLTIHLENQDMETIEEKEILYYKDYHTKIQSIKEKQIK